MSLFSESSRLELTEIRVLGTSTHTNTHTHTHTLYIYIYIYVQHSTRHVIPKEVKYSILISLDRHYIFIPAKRTVFISDRSKM